MAILAGMVLSYCYVQCSLLVAMARTSGPSEWSWVLLGVALGLVPSLCLTTVCVSTSS